MKYEIKGVHKSDLKLILNLLVKIKMTEIEEQIIHTKPKQAPQLAQSKLSPLHQCQNELKNN